MTSLVEKCYKIDPEELGKLLELLERSCPSCLVQKRTLTRSMLTSSQAKSSEMQKSLSTIVLLAQFVEGPVG